MLSHGWLQAAEIWEELGGWITTNKPEFGPGTKERFQMASQLQPDEVTMQNTTLIILQHTVHSVFGKLLCCQLLCILTGKLPGSAIECMSPDHLVYTISNIPVCLSGIPVCVRVYISDIPVYTSGISVAPTWEQHTSTACSLNVLHK